MVLPANAVGQAGYDRLVHQQVMQASEHRPRNQRHQTHTD